jgi:hypothetical protein
MDTTCMCDKRCCWSCVVEDEQPATVGVEGVTLYAQSVGVKGANGDESESRNTAVSKRGPRTDERSRYSQTVEIESAEHSSERTWAKD